MHCHGNRPDCSTILAVLRAMARNIPRFAWLAEFPANREKNREFRRFGRFPRKSVSKSSVNSARCENEFPTQQNRELIRDIRELIPPYQAGTGNKARYRSARLKGSLHASPWLSKCRRRGRSTRSGGASIDPLGTGRVERTAERLYRLVRHSREESAAVGGGVNRERPHPEAPRRTDDPAGNFATICDEDFFEHPRSS